MVDIEKTARTNLLNSSKEQLVEIILLAWKTDEDNQTHIIERDNKIEELRELIKWKDEALEDFVISTEEELSHQPDWKQLLEALALKEKV